MKKWFKSKTLWFNIILTLIFGVEQFAQTDLINPEIAIFIITVFNGVLRFVTKEAIQTTKAVG